MNIELNPLKWGHKDDSLSKIAALSIPEQPAAPAGVSMANEFVSIMDKIGADIKIVWDDVVKYLPTAVSLAALIFPASAVADAGAVTALDLIQQAVATVEQKFAAQGSPTGTGAQKLAQVLAIVTPSVTSLLAQFKITANQAYITQIVNAVVAILNVQAAA